jgi:hypothetical protein
LSHRRSTLWASLGRRSAPVALSGIWCSADAIYRAVKPSPIFGFDPGLDDACTARVPAFFNTLFSAATLNWLAAFPNLSFVTAKRAERALTK